MNKKTLRIAGWALGLSMAVAGIGVVVGASQKAPVEAKAETKTYSLTISASDFNTTSYAANNNEKTSKAVNTSNDKDEIDVSWTSNQVMKSGDNMQWQKSKGYIYNSTNLGTITGITVNSSAGTFTTYYGTEEHPTSGTTVGNGFFTVAVGNATGTTSSVVITFEKTIEPLVTYDVSFNSNGGTGEMAALLDQTGTYNLPACGFTAPSGKAFAGWKADNKGELLPVGHPYTLESDVVFYAQWANAYNVTYSAGEHGSGSCVVSNQAEGTYTLLDFEDLDGVTASSGYRFVNYTVNDVDKDPGDTITLSANTSITVNFEKIPINTTYDFEENFSTYASEWSGYGDHVGLDGKETIGGDYSATVDLYYASKQTGNTASIKTMPVFASKTASGYTKVLQFTLNESGYKIKSVTVTFRQWADKTPSVAIYKGAAVAGDPLDTATIGTKNTLNVANLNGTVFTVGYCDGSSSNVQAGLKSIFIELEELSSFGTLDHIAVATLPNTVYHVGETYSASGLTVMAYDGANEATANFKDVTASISALLENGYTFEESDVPGIENEIEYTEGNETKYTSFNVDVYALAEYELVTSEPADWSGNYLIVGETDASDLVALNGGLTNPDVEGDYKDVSEKSSGVIEAGQELEWTVSTIAGGYSIQGKSGKYIGSLTSASNGMLVGNDAITNSLDLSGSSVVITGTNGYKLRFNTAGQGRFRYYDGSYTVKLYKLKISDNADAFATTFMNAFSCDANGTNKPSFAIKEGETRWTWALLAAEYDTLTNSEKEQFRTGVASEAGTNIQQALARYDYIVGKYLKGGLDNTFTDFMSRNPSPIAGAYNVSIETKNHTIDSLLVISGASIAIAALGGIFLISRRRREE